MRATRPRSRSICTPNPTDSRTGVSGSSVPNTPNTGRSSYSPSAVSSLKSRSWSVSTQTSPASSSQSTPKSRLDPSGLPSRLMSRSRLDPYTPMVSALTSSNRAMRKRPSRGAVYVESRYTNEPPAASTMSSICCHQPLSSISGSSTLRYTAILGTSDPSSARAVCNSGSSMSGSMSIMPILTPRPSQVGLFSRNSSARMSPSGLYRSRSGWSPSTGGSAGPPASPNDRGRPVIETSALCTSASATSSSTPSSGTQARR